MDNDIPVLLFALKDPENIVRAVKGEKIGTIVKAEPTDLKLERIISQRR